MVIKFSETNTVQLLPFHAVFWLLPAKHRGEKIARWSRDLEKLCAVFWEGIRGSNDKSWLWLHIAEENVKRLSICLNHATYKNLRIKPGIQVYRDLSNWLIYSFKQKNVLPISYLLYLPSSALVSYYLFSKCCNSAAGVRCHNCGLRDTSTSKQENNLFKNSLGRFISNLLPLYNHCTWIV